jgi:hypothetical protein
VCGGVPARERGPDEVVVGEPVVEDGDEGLPLGVLVVHAGLLGLLGLHCLLFLLLLGLGLPAPRLLLLHDLRLRLHRCFTSCSSQLRYCPSGSLSLSVSTSASRILKYSVLNTR